MLHRMEADSSLLFCTTILCADRLVTMRFLLLLLLGMCWACVRHVLGAVAVAVVAPCMQPTPNR